ncbi:MAG: DUF4115 domain-containing protein [Candidatus Omnitrophota bacterium]|nr:DUF4115 domain-containing protein [Candidatus Omnitrophota bacterium]
MEYLGALLKSTREKKKLSLEEVHKHTRIPKEILRDIEMDRISTLNPVYLRGYLKIYSKYLGMDQATIAQAYKGILPKEGNPVLVPARSKRPEQDNAILPQFNPFIILNIIVVLVLLFSSFSFIKHIVGKKKLKEAKVVFSVSRPPAAAKKTVAPAKKEPVPQQNQKKPAPLQEKIESVKLAIRAKDNTYLHVKTDGNSVFQGTLKKGQTENWVAKETIGLSIGSAASVELEINGRAVSSLGRKNQPINNMLISRDGSFQIK